MKATFLVIVRTNVVPVEEETYMETCHELDQLMNRVLGDEDIVALLCHTTECTTSTECNVSLDETGVIAQCVVTVEAEKKPVLDKPKLSQQLKAFSKFDGIKIEKRAVEMD